MIALELEPCWQDSPIKTVDALPPIDSSPCESGCPHLSLCQSKELSCQAYHNYANSRKFESSAREPSTFFYEQTFEVPPKTKGVFVRLEQIEAPAKPTTTRKEKTMKTQTKTAGMENPTLSDKAFDALVAALQETPKPQGAVSVERLVNLAMTGTSSAAAAAAQVLLSAWNGRDWQVSVSDLGYLDPVNRGAALDVIDLRANGGIEPYTQIPNGNQIFVQLASRWQRYRIDNRHKDDCRKCYGTGEVFSNEDDENDTTTETCPRCDGQGYL